MTTDEGWEHAAAYLLQLSSLLTTTAWYNIHITADPQSHTAFHPHSQTRPKHTWTSPRATEATTYSQSKASKWFWFPKTRHPPPPRLSHEILSRKITNRIGDKWQPWRRSKIQTQLLLWLYNQMAPFRSYSCRAQLTDVYQQFTKMSKRLNRNIHTYKQKAFYIITPQMDKRNKHSSRSRRQLFYWQGTTQLWCLFQEVILCGSVSGLKTILRSTLAECRAASHKPMNCTLLQLRLVMLVPLHQSASLCGTERRVQDFIEPRVSLFVVNEVRHLIHCHRPVIPSPTERQGQDGR